MELFGYNKRLIIREKTLTQYDRIQQTFCWQFGTIVNNMVEIQEMVSGKKVGGLNEVIEHGAFNFSFFSLFGLIFG
ncbi:MAG: hypothetical protein ACOX2X_02655 [Peptococcia bacterium]|jgi:hypothetical protein